MEIQFKDIPTGAAFQFAPSAYGLWRDPIRYKKLCARTYQTIDDHGNTGGPIYRVGSIAARVQLKSGFLFSAYTIDGGLIFGADDRAAFLARLGDHVRQGKRPHVGFEYDARQHPVPAFPYTVWRPNGPGDVSGIEGTPCRTFDDVAAVWKMWRVQA